MGNIAAYQEGYTDGYSDGMKNRTDTILKYMEDFISDNTEPEPNHEFLGGYNLGIASIYDYIKKEFKE